MNELELKVSLLSYPGETIQEHSDAIGMRQVEFAKLLFTFLLEIRQSQKNTIRLNFHHQENDGKIGLLRVDYNSGHKNPEGINEFLPDKFHPFVGKHFANHEHHIHYHVQGYKTLAWALPLEVDDFKIKEISNNDDFNNIFVQIIKAFAETINIETKLEFNQLLI